MAEEIQALVHPSSEMSNQALLAQRLAWQQFEQSTHTVRVEQIRSRMLPIAGSNRFRAAVTLELFNEHGRDVDVLVKFENLPEGWQAKVAQVHLGPPGLQRQANGGAVGRGHLRARERRRQIAAALEPDRGHAASADR